VVTIKSKRETRLINGLEQKVIWYDNRLVVTGHNRNNQITGEWKMETGKFAVECAPENAGKFAEWIKSRGGIAVWTSANLGNAGATWSTPALDQAGKPYGKPTWQASNTPTIITDPAQVGVYNETLFKAFAVGLRRGDGFSFNLTDGAMRRLDKVMAQCEEKHGSAHYVRGVGDFDGASMGVFYTSGITPLNEWKGGTSN
jgi:hypothetical protein